MKRIFTLLLLAIALSASVANAQNTVTCNAGFTAQPLTTFTYKFTPAVADSPLVHHFWNFGDYAAGNGYSYNVAPQYTFSGPGTYYVGHAIYRVDAAGNYLCSDTATKVINIYLPCNIQASFVSAPDATDSNKINFTNTTVNYYPTDSIRWTFGDGTVSYDVNPSHTYTTGGTYTVCLRVKRNAVAPTTTPCVSEICKTVTIVQSTACTLHTNFSWHADTIINNKIYFTNLSTPLANTDSVRWTFGDGASSGFFNPDHTYATGGSYTVCLRVIKRTANGTLTNCIKDTCFAIAVQEPCNLTAGFISHKDSLATSPYTYYFQNTSAPLAATDSIRWTFGDGTTSNAVNPTHVYAQSGTYMVCLRVIKRTSAGVLSSCIKETCSTLVIATACTVQPNFSWAKDSINNRKIYFTNLTPVPVTNITFTWSFGDGTTATSYNAVHEYAQPGRYYVCLRAAYGNCVTYKCDSITVLLPSPACTQLANYSYTKSATDNQLFSFKPDYVGTDIQYTWTFGDGTGSHDALTTHHFAASGAYTVCLTAYRNANCAATTCKGITVLPQINCDSVSVYFSDSRDSLAPNRITFTASASQLILDQVWTITRATATGGQVILHQNNPTYLFADTGYYNVCLKVTTVGGCIKTYCKNIYINQLGSNACQLQAYPNPTSTLVNVNVLLSQPQTIYVYLYNSVNLLLATKTQAGIAGNNIVTMNTGNLAAGLYTLKFVYGNNVCYARFQKF